MAGNSDLYGFGTGATGGSNSGFDFGTTSLPGMNDVSSQNSWMDGWTNKDMLGLGGLAVQGGLGLASYFGQNEMNKLAMDQAKYDRLRQEKEDADYDAFKASWAGGFGNATKPTTSALPTSGTTIGTQVAPVSAFGG